MKNPLTPAGIEPATFRIVAQHLNHCATVIPIGGRIILKWLVKVTVQLQAFVNLWGLTYMKKFTAIALIKHLMLFEEIITVYLQILRCTYVCCVGKIMFWMWKQVVRIVTAVLWRFKHHLSWLGLQSYASEAQWTLLNREYSFLFKKLHCD